ncbi:MAG: MurT ligase domain-containing protein [Coriobacteriia bacterium]|nr:MurT ligase domain-containing protein [Coriobacteriia bacterium]
MGLRETAARCAGSLSRHALQGLLHRDATSFPGKLALRLDPDLIAHAASSLTCGSIVIVGTNGKTTTTNLIADALERTGATVCCNRAGANMNTGVATALMADGRAQWGVIECDELWLPHVLPQLQPRYLVLLNLFRDQLDRSGEIDVVQQCILRALEQSPATTLLFNADDPLCARIALEAPNPRLSFGVAASMGLAQNSVADAQICQRCSQPLTYAFHQYGQLGDYACPTCGFARPALDFAAQDVRLSASGVQLELAAPAHLDEKAYRGKHAVRPAAADAPVPYHAELPGAYMAYNLTAAAAAATLLGCPPEAIQQAMTDFAPNNGRLERLVVGQHPTLVNLAKNPTGMNQNLRIALADQRPFVLGVFINDQDADGHDVSWLWDVDFEELASRPDLRVFAGGVRKHDLQVRLKYAGVNAELADGPADLVAAAQAAGPDCPVYAIANYTALPAVKSGMEALAQPGAVLPDARPVPKPASTKNAAASAQHLAPTNGCFAPLRESNVPTKDAYCEGTASDFPTSQDLPVSPAFRASTDSASSPVIIGHLFPQLLNLYGDGGNATVLRRRLEWRGIPVEVRAIDEHAPFDLADVDLLFLGGAPDREQEIASRALMEHAAELRTYVESGSPCLAICGGFQMLGRSWILNGRSVPGLALGAFETRRAGTSRDRLVDNVVLQVPGIDHPVVGYENHAGRTFLDDPATAFGQLTSKTGHGNNDQNRADGYASGNLLCTYLHGPLLAKNPQVADLLLARALKRWSERTGSPAPALAPLDDTVELRANAFMAAR